MTHGARRNLHHGNIRTAQAFRIIIRRQIPHDHPHAHTAAEHLRRLLQQRGLAGPGGRKNIDNQKILCCEKTSVALCQPVIGVQHRNMDVHAVAVTFMGVLTSASAFFTHNQY